MQRLRLQQEERKLDLVTKGFPKVRKGFPKVRKEFCKVPGIWTGSGSGQSPC